MISPHHRFSLCQSQYPPKAVVVGKCQDTDHEETLELVKQYQMTLPGKNRLLLLMAQKSGDHQLRLVVYTIFYRVLYMSGGCLGFLPSTVPKEFGLVRWAVSFKVVSMKPLRKQQRTSSVTPLMGTIICDIELQNPHPSLVPLKPIQKKTTGVEGWIFGRFPSEIQVLFQEST